MICENIFKSFFNTHIRLKSFLLSCRDVFRRSISLFKLVVLNLFVRFFLRHPKYNKKYKISICGIFKNESCFLKEWIEYHKILGVEHFYLYNNKSDDNFKIVLQPYIDKGLVSLIDWPFDQAQMKAYEHFYNTYRHETQWVSFLDIDEFFCPRYKSNLYEWLTKKDRFPAILIYWRMFGTSGKLLHDPEKLVIEQYTVSWDHLYHVGKCLINTDYDLIEFNSSTHHLPQVKYPLFGKIFKIQLPPVNQFGLFVKDPFHFSWFYREKNFTIQINHYWSKAWDVYEKKRRMTDVFFKENPKINLSYFYEHEYENRSVDYTIFRFIMQLKLKTGVYKNDDYEL